AKRVQQIACIHCHQIFEFERERLQQLGRWRRQDVWIYPQPENVGLELDVDQGNRIKGVAPDSAAAKAGLCSGDVLKRVNGLPVASIADMQYALHQTPNKGQLPILWERDGKTQAANLLLRDGWRISDISWRASVRRIGPSPCVYGY